MNDDEQFENLLSKILAEEKEKATLDEKLLAHFLSVIDEKVTVSEENRSILQRDDNNKGRISVNNDQIHNFMAINWKLVFGVIILAIIASVSYYQFVLKTPSEVAEVAKAPTEVNIVPATGNVDDAVLALLNDADAEAAILANVENDANLITADSQAINDFGQSYNEKF
jgi:hypothetical protein